MNTDHSARKEQTAEREPSVCQEFSTAAERKMVEIERAEWL